MSKSYVTKCLIATALKETMQNVSLADITVSSLVEKTGINRKTFYNHFKDKYDLVNWIFCDEVAVNIAGYYKLATWPQASLMLCYYIRANALFYTSALRYSGQNSLVQYLEGFFYEKTAVLCKEAVGSNTFSKADFDFAVDYLSHASFCVFLTWIKNGMEESPEIIVKRIQIIVDNCMNRLLASLSG